jgi:hypothetical protein
MRKLIFTTLFALTVMGINAQTLDDINDLYSKQQWDKAKEQIDKYLANEKNAKKPDGWYLKAAIYNEVAKSEKFKSLLGNTDGRMEAFNSLKKYLEMDPKNIKGTLEQNVRFFDIYNGYFDLAAGAFNAKNYDLAFENFKNAMAVEEFVASKGFSYNNFSFPKLDTSLILNTAISAAQAKKMDDAMIYYQKLADAKVGGPSYQEIYQSIVQYYNEKGDKATRDKYLAIGRELYPEDDYWTEIELRDAGTDKKALFAKYDELLIKNPGKYILHYNYSAELFNYLFTQEKKPADYQAQYARLQDILKKGIAIKSTPEANLLLARAVYNGIYDLQDASEAIKGNKPDDVKKKNELKTKMAAQYEQMLPYATAAYDIYDGKTTLKGSEKGNFKVATDLITRYWESKNNKEKIKFYQDKMKEL